MCDFPNEMSFISNEICIMKFIFYFIFYGDDIMISLVNGELLIV